MNKSLKAALAFALALVIIPTSISAPAQAVDRTVACSEAGNFTITGTEITASTEDCAGEVLIPADVTQIGGQIFQGRTGVTSLTFEANSNLKGIGNWAFNKTNISSVDLPDGLESMGWWVFAETKLTTLSVPGTVNNFQDDMFRSAVFTNVVFERRIAANLKLGAVIFNNSPNATATFIGPVVVGPYDWNNYAVPVDGYTWQGWSASPGGPIVTFPLTVQEPGVTLYQVRTPNTYVVNFDSKSGSAVSASSFVTDGAISSEPVAPTRSGYAFAGWSADDGGTAVSFPYEPEVTRDITLYALWTPNTNSASFVSQGGSAVSPASFVTGGEISSAPVAPTRVGYTFAGWSETEDGTAVSFPYTPDATEDITLYALWTVTPFAVNFDSKGGSAVIASSFVSGGEISSAPVAPTRVGYTFAGWSVTDGGTAVSFPYTPSVAVDITLYAKWILVNVKAAATVKPTISGTAKVKSKLTTKPGTWTGAPTPKLTYQWYSCTKAVAAATSTIPKTCKALNGKTSSTLTVATTDKSKFIAVRVTGTSTGTSATIWLSKSTSVVK